MRSDMAKIIVERPRRKDWKGDNSDKNPFRFSRNTPWSEDDDDDMAFNNFKESMRKSHKLAGSYKELNENLNPLHAFIAKSVGRQWNDVYSEIRARINASSATQLHILEHVKQYVCTDMQAINEALNGIYIWRFNNHSFYVDAHGKLCKFPPRPKYVKPEFSKNVLFGEIKVKPRIQTATPKWMLKSSLTFTLHGVDKLNAEIKGKKFPTHFCYNGLWFAIDWIYDYYSFTKDIGTWNDKIKHQAMIAAFSSELRVGREHMSPTSFLPDNASLRFRNLKKKELKELRKKIGE